MLMSKLLTILAKSARSNSRKFKSITSNPSLKLKRALSAMMNTYPDFFVTQLIYKAYARGVMHQKQQQKTKLEQERKLKNNEF